MFVEREPSMKVVQVFCLSLFLSLCGATEFYVRPTEPTDASCPGQPCLTLSQYISDSDLYFKSNTVFKFLPGLHYTNQTLGIQNVKNVLLEGEKEGDHPIVVMDIHCSNKECAGFRFENINTMAICSLNFSVSIHASSSVPSNEDLPVSGLMFIAVNTLRLRNTSIQYTSSDLIPHSSAVTVFASKNIVLDSLSTACDSDSMGIVIGSTEEALVVNSTVTFGVYGIAVKDSRNIRIASSNITSTSLGIVLYSSTSVNIWSATVNQSINAGIYTYLCQHARIQNSLVTHTEGDGILLTNSNHSKIINTTVLHSQHCGVYLSFVRHTAIAKSLVAESSENGIFIRASEKVVVFNSSVMDIGVKNSSGDQVTSDPYEPNAVSSTGISLEEVDTAVLCGVSVTHSEGNGIEVSYSFNTTIASTLVTLVGGKEIVTSHTFNSRILLNTFSSATDCAYFINNNH